MFVKIIPFWVPAYFAGYITFCLWSYVSDLRAKKIDIWLISDILGTVFLLLPAIAYWYPPLSVFLGGIKSTLFVFGFVANIVFAYRGYKKHFPDSKLSSAENTGLGLFSTALIITVVSPLVWWGIQSLGWIR